MTTTETEELQVSTRTDTTSTNSDSDNTANNRIDASYEDELSREFRFARFIVRCPCLLCCIMIFIILIFCIIFGAFFNLTLTNTRASFPDNNDEYVTDFDAYSLAAEFVQYDEEEIANTVTQSEEISSWQYIMFFELNQYKNDFDQENPSKTDYWLLTPENIKTILKYEDKIYADTEWNNKFCWVGNDPIDTNYTCNDAVISPARKIAEFYDYDYDSFTTEDVKNYTKEFLTDYAYCFNPGAFETGQIYVYRSFFKAGAPIGNGKVEWMNNTRVHLSDYKNSEDQLDSGSATGQMGEYYEWGFSVYQDIIIDHDANLVDGNVKISVFCPSIHGNYVLTAFNNSSVFLVLAILVVWVYMTYHLHSLFLSSGAMFGILMSFPSAYFVYRVIFGVPIFDGLSTLIVFVLLGVGADDVFVFTDAWTQSASFVGRINTKPDDLKTTCCGCEHSTEARDLKRMSFTFRRAAMAMLVTQVTTFFAFLATATSILINMSAFGIWAACVVMMNYVLVITLYPAVLMIHHKYIKKYEEKICCCCCNLICSKKKKKSESPAPSIKPQLSRQSSVLEISQQYGKFESFLGMKWSAWIIKFKYYALAIFLILFILTAIGASLLETASNVDDAFEDDHWFIISQNNLHKFTASETDSLVSSHITFGIKGVDKDGVKKYEPDEYYGKIIWQNDFNIATPQQQLYLKYICNSLKNRTDLAYSSDTVYCPIIDFETYLETKTSYSFPYQYNGDDMTQSEAFAAEWSKFFRFK